MPYEYNEETGYFERTGTADYTTNFDPNNFYLELHSTDLKEPVILEY